MCKAILEGLRRHLDQQQRHRQGVKATFPLEAFSEEDNRDALFIALAAQAHLDQKEVGDVVDATTGQILRGERPDNRDVLARRRGGATHSPGADIEPG